MLSGAALAALLSVTSGSPGGLTSTKATFATLKCANPRLPAAILDGANASITQDVNATPLPTVNVTGAANPLTLALAADSATRARGLMCVTAIRPHAGMLFAFPQPGQYEFWMKDTVTPLDMVWVGADGTVHNVFANVPAATLETSDEKVARRRGQGRYVIELRSGAAAREHITVGTKLTVPPVDAT